MENLEMGGQSSAQENQNEQEERTQITKGEMDKFIMGEVGDEELKKWMEEKGIEYDQGMIKISLDGKDHLFNTDKNDFGTLSGPDDKIGLN